MNEEILRLFKPMSSSIVKVENQVIKNHKLYFQVRVQ